jgi:hypothetical protein
MTTEIPTSLRFLLASELAYAGGLSRAKSLLTQKADYLRTPEELDLLARIYVQQELYTDARACWEQAAAISPDNPLYQQAMSALREHQERLRLHHRITMSLYAFMALIGLAAVLLLLLFRDLA